MKLHFSRAITTFKLGEHSDIEYIRIDINKWICLDEDIHLNSDDISQLEKAYYTYKVLRSFGSDICIKRSTWNYNNKSYLRSSSGEHFIWNGDNLSKIPHDLKVILEEAYLSEHSALKKSVLFTKLKDFIKSRDKEIEVIMEDSNDIEFHVNDPFLMKSSYILTFDNSLDFIQIITDKTSSNIKSIAELKQYLDIS